MRIPRIGEATRSGAFWFVVAVAVLVAPDAGAADPPMPAGRVELVEGDVLFIDAAQRGRRPVRGDGLLSGETVIAGQDGEVHLTMEDSGYLAVRPNTQFKVVDYKARGGKDDRSILRLIKGTFRAITGWIPRVSPRGYRIETATATIGVRGTDHEPMFIPEGSPIGPAGTYDKVNEGETSMEDDSGVLYVPPNTAGYSPLTEARKARILEQIPEFFKGTVREHLVSGKHKAIQERLEERLKERLRLNDQPGSAQESPGQLGPAGEPTEQSAEGGTKSSAGSKIPLSGVGIPGAAILANPPAAGGATVAPLSGVAPNIPLPDLVPAERAPAPVARPASRPSEAAPDLDPKSSSSIVAPAGRPEPRKPGAPRGSRDSSGIAPPRSEAQTDALDRQRAYQDRRRELQSDHRGQYERDRDTDLNRDPDRVREADRIESRRRREQR